MKLNMRRLGLAVLFAGASAFAALPAAPGVVNFVEGQATLDGQALSGSSVGSAQLERGRSAPDRKREGGNTPQPCVFLRVGQNSAVRMVSPDLLDTSVALELRHLREVAPFCFPKLTQTL